MTGTEAGNMVTHGSVVHITAQFRVAPVLCAWQGRLRVFLIYSACILKWLESRQKKQKEKEKKTHITILYLKNDI